MRHRGGKVLDRVFRALTGAEEESGTRWTLAPMRLTPEMELSGRRRQKVVFLVSQERGDFALAGTEGVSGQLAPGKFE